MSVAAGGADVGCLWCGQTVIGIGHTWSTLLPVLSIVLRSNVFPAMGFLHVLLAV